MKGTEQRERTGRTIRWEKQDDESERALENKRSPPTGNVRARKQRAGKLASKHGRKLNESWVCPTR